MTAQTEERALEVLDRKSGELIDVKKAHLPRLAQFFVNLDELRAQLTDAEEVVQAEVLGRLDRSGKWTEHVSTGEGYLVDLKAPSPAAGTVAYDVDTLEKTLQQLVDDVVIDRQAAERALERTVTVTFAIPWGEQLDDVVEKAKQDERVVDVLTSRKAVKGGISAIEKLGPAVIDALEAARRRVPQGRRRVSFKWRKAGAS